MGNFPPCGPGQTPGPLQPPNLQDYTAFLYNVVGIPPANLPESNQIIFFTLALAAEIVNHALPGLIRTLAVYNLAADRLINFAQDVEGQGYFIKLREQFRIYEVSTGVAAQASDQGTAVGILNPEQMKLFTMQDLQTLKTPYGRQYMAFAQMYGRTIWGLT